MDSGGDAVADVADRGPASGSGVVPARARLWVNGRLVSGAAAVAAALERVRARAAEPALDTVREMARDPAEARDERAKPPPPGEATSVDPEVLLKTAGKLFHQLKVKEAIRIYENVAGLPSTRAEANTGLGWCYLSLRDFERSIRSFEAALDAVPDFGRALYGVGVSLIEVGRMEEAASYARRLAGLASPEERARGLYVLGLADRARGAWEEAAAHLEASLRTHPHKNQGQPGWSEIRHRYELALCYRELNRPERALEHLQWAAKHERRAGPIVLDLAKLELELGRHDEAERDFLAVLKHTPSNRTALVGLGHVQLARGDYNAAVQSFSRVLSRGSDDFDALNGMAESYKGLGDFDRAAGYIKKVGQLYKTPQAQLEKRLRSLENERQMRDAELLRMRNIAALNIMATGIAHELRQPLTVIRMAAQNARLDMKKGVTSNADADLEDIDKNIVRLDKVISVLRDAATDDVATDEVVSLDAAIDAALSLFHTQLALRGIEVILHHTSGVQIVGSRVALQQVLINLISNARDALAEARTKRIRIAAAEQGGKVRIEIGDTGAGMSEAVREKALDPFYTTKKNGGTGLGLYICHNLVRRMSGTFRIKETSVGRGTTFEIVLRRAEGGSHG
jgi:signal transduction histidine kinase/Flp pilus assembly protein TadD